MDGNGWGVSKESDERVEPMTYTFKLSRRLAVSRYAILAAAAVLVGCDSETTTAPESDLHPAPVLDRVRLVPNSVTVETNQSVRFRAERVTPRGQRHALPLTWHASGGVIDEAGIFKATEPGPNGAAIYVFVMNPVAKGAEYSVGNILVEGFGAEGQTLYKTYSEAYANPAIGALLHLTRVLDLGK